jgi:hypothetical protein
LEGLVKNFSLQCGRRSSGSGDCKKQEPEHYIHHAWALFSFNLIPCISFHFLIIQDYQVQYTCHHPSERMAAAGFALPNLNAPIRFSSIVTDDNRNARQCKQEVNCIDSDSIHNNPPI